jgi:hypothetical protein
VHRPIDAQNYSEKKKRKKKVKKNDAQNDCTMPCQITITTAHHSKSSRQQPYLNKLVRTPIERCLKLEKTHMDFTIKALDS